MNTAPQTINLTEFRVRNGRPALAEDAIAADRYATWLATQHIPHPAITGVFTAGTVHASIARVPAFVSEVHVQYLCSGRGSIETIWDGASSSVTVTAGAGTSGAHSLEEATWWAPAAPFAVTAIDGPASKAWSFELDDLGGGKTLRVYAVAVTMLAPEAGTALP